MNVCPARHPRSEIQGGYLASPVRLPLTQTLLSAAGRFNDPKRNGYNPLYAWGDDGVLIGHQGLDLGSPIGGWLTAMADGPVAKTDLDPYSGNTDAGVWLATLNRCPECGGWFCFRHLHLQVGSVLVKAGDMVVKGQKLARTGQTGSAHWPHTHTDLLHSTNPNADKAGSFGPEWGVPYDGVVWGFLAVPPPTPPAPAPTLVSVTVDRQVLRKGDKGQAVLELQQHLAWRGFDPGPFDGDFGSRTEAALRAFQHSRGLPEDGVAGAAAWSALLDY